jgi:salicylate hydroxylase
MHARHLEIALIGAGLAGLTTARALQLQGCSVRVYEQAEALAEVGAGLTITPNATHVLNAVGLAPVLERAGLRPQQGGVKHWRSGEVLTHIARGQDMLEKYGAAYFQIHRADIHAGLVEAVRTHDPAALQLGCRFESLRDHGRRVTLRFANGREGEADVVVAADGARSAVRTQVFGSSQPTFTGYIAYRGLVPTATLPAGIIEPSSCLSIGPRRSFTRYLVRGGTLVNYVGLCERDDWQQEGWSIRSSVAEVLREYEDWYADVRTIIAATPEHLIYKWALFDRDPLPLWVKGRVTLAGDAAHPMLPFLGQGAAMGFEDAMVLARALAARDSIGAALRCYFEARQPRTTMVLLKSRETARDYHSGDLDEYASRTHLSAESLGLMSYNPVTVPL